MASWCFGAPTWKVLGLTGDPICSSSGVAVCVEITAASRM